MNAKSRVKERLAWGVNVSGWIAAAVVIWCVRTPPVPRAMAPTERPWNRQHEAPIMLDLADVRHFDGFLAAVERASGLPVHMHWERVGHSQTLGDLSSLTPVWFPAARLSLGDAIDQVNSILSNRPVSHTEVLDYRTHQDRIELADGGYFDRKETQLLFYNVGPLLNRMARTAGRDEPLTAEEYAKNVSNLLTSVIEPDSWLDGGGEYATCRFIGSSLVIEAPARFHPKIAWILDQINRAPGTGPEMERLIAGLRPTWFDRPSAASGSCRR